MSSIWGDLEPYLCTKSQRANGATSYHKSWKGQLGWRRCYDKMGSKGLFEGNKVRKKKKKPVIDVINVS